MTREHDWKIHELMGNDLTGWEWLLTDSNDIFIKQFPKSQYRQIERIPHYSTTWEGAGLVMEWLMNQGIRHRIEAYGEDGKYAAWVQRGTWDNQFPFYVNKIGASAPLALAKAFIAAMEERDNG